MPEPENKTKIVTLRFRPSALQDLDAMAKAVNLTRSAYITRKLTGLPVLPARVPAVNWQLYGELAEIAASLSAIGNNINQIAKVLNEWSKRGETIPDSLPLNNDFSLEKAMESIETILPLLTEVRLALSGVKKDEYLEDSSTQDI